ncbi:MAG: hypothetical protein H8Z69_00215 [Nanohaloarchaea archaeon]|nr:hypothetical protein [Candidatus Nanohaloarchaea archaeon]
MNGNSIEDYDAVFATIRPKNAVFGRVLLEMTEEKGVNTNISSTCFFTLSKKNYLYYVLKKRDIKSPNTVVVPSEKAARNVHNQVEPPLVGRKIENLEETEIRKLETVEDIQSFAEGTEYETDVLLFQNYDKGEKYRCLVVGDEIISLKDDSDSWKFKDENPKYSNISDSKEQKIRECMNSLGTSVAEVKLRGEQIFDINPNPDLQLFSDASGKNVYETVADLLKEDEK